MKTIHFNAYFDHMISQVAKTRDDGQKEYARTEDNVFANFDRVANALNISREKALMVYLLKHIDGINAYLEGHHSQREEVAGRITDAITYLFLLWAMIDGEKDLKKLHNGTDIVESML